VGLKTGLDTEVRRKIFLPLPRIEPRSPGRPVRNQTLHCLSYSGSSSASVDIYLYCFKFVKVKVSNSRRRHICNFEQREYCVVVRVKVKAKQSPLHAMEALGGRGDVAPTHSRPRH
jgi:hypothetical protein